MDPTTAAEKRLDALLETPLLEVPDGFAARVMAALPAPSAPAATPRRRSWLRLETHAGWPAIQALLTTACGVLGAVEVLLFVGGLWATTQLGAG
jgi:hypothetical protein